jgi:integrase
MRKPPASKKLIYLTSFVFRWGIADGLCAGNPAIAQALALPRTENKSQNRKALPYAEVAGCIEAVRPSSAWAAKKLALEFLVLTPSRSGEVCFARWEEFDLHGADSARHAFRVTWYIPAERMKMGRVHRVPLSRRAIEILAEAETLRDGSGLVFPSIRGGKALSDMTLSKLVKELGFPVDVHGFPTSFRTWTQERTNFPREVAEAALAHIAGDAAERAYARSDLFEKRRKMMEAWAGFLAEEQGKVVRIG